MESAVLVIEVAILVSISAISSGLNVAVMSLDPSRLERRAKLGNKQAAKAFPLRHNKHLTLASILLANVAVIAATSLVLGEKYNGLIALVMSTLLIVIFGEIIPQAIFVRHALPLTAFFASWLRVLIIITYPLSKPLQLLLDKMLGFEDKPLESRHELGILIAEHAARRGSELDENEIDIMQGALSLSEKRVKDIMTPIDKVFWVEPNTALNDAKIDEIKDSGYSRIPVFNQSMTKCYGIVLVKDLVDIDFDDNHYIVEDMFYYPTKVVGAMTALDTIFRTFIRAGTHLLPVEKDDKIVGVITIEDVFEEIIGQEIEDESDRQRGKRRRRLFRN
jgi:metal transporter CNNM